MPQTKISSTYKTGLYINKSKALQPKDSYSYALNAVKEDAIDSPDILNNEKGFTQYINLGYPYVLLGTIYLGKKDYIYFIKNPDASATIFNKVILVEDQVITTLIDTVDLNFNSNNLIKGTYRVNYRNERIIYWVDGLNKDRVYNIDTAETITDINELSLDIVYIPAILSSKSVDDNNGNLVTGAYEFYASYKTDDNAVTPWFILNAKPINIIKSSTNGLSPSEYINVEGSDSNLPTTKSIKLEISNLDPNFNKLRIGIIKTINGTSTGYYIDDVFYDSSTKEYTYTGFNDEESVANLNEFTVDLVRYYGSNAIIQSGNRLVRANTKAVNINIDYQQYANNIVVDYYVDEDLVMTMPDSTDYNVRSDWWRNAATKYSDEQSLMRDEVYSVGVAFGLKKEGIETEVYHIPGRALNNIPVSIYESEYSDVGAVSYISTWDSQSVTDNGDTVPRWKVQNTAAKSTNGLVHKLAYWESDNKYPDGYDFPVTGSTTNGTNNTNIRHHKIPSSNIEPIYRTELVAGTFNIYKRNIGLTFSNIEIPDSIKDNIVYVRIYITPRDIEQNKSIIAKGIFTNCSYTKIFGLGDPQHASSSNYYVVPVQPYNDLDDILDNGIYQGVGLGDGSAANTKSNHYHSFYSPDTLFKKPVINTDRVYIENELSGTVHYYNTYASNINIDPALRNDPHRRSASDNGGYKRDVFYKGGSDDGGLIPTRPGVVGSDVYNVSNVFKTTYKSICIFNNISKVPSAKVTRKVKKAAYVPFNATLTNDQLGGMDNPYYSPKGAANVLIELDTTKPVLGPTLLVDNSVQFQDTNPSVNILHRVANRDQGAVMGTFHFHPVNNQKAVYRYGSIKRTNPTQYGTILGLNYIPTDLVLANPTLDINNKITVSLSGLIGDTYIDLFSLKRVRYAAKENYTYGGLPEASLGMSSFFTEAQVNFRLRYSYGVYPDVYYPKILLTTPPQDYMSWENSPAIINNDNYYKENTDFDKISSKQNYGVTQLDLQTEGLVNYPTRIVYSEKMLNETIADSYRVFLANNYLDLPKNTGGITSLFNKQQELYAITRDSLWRLFASNQTIKSSTEEDITVGTGEFLANTPIEVLSIEGGYAGTSSKASLVETPYGYFYCDRYKGRFILFDGQQKDIALRGVNQFTEENFELEIINQIKALDSDFDSPLLNYGYLAGYEPENNRLLITKLDYKFTAESFANYKGIYNPATTYAEGDIYLKDGVFYTYFSTNTAYATILNSSNLNDFVPSTVNPISFSVGSASHGTAIIAPSDNTKVSYTPTTNYIGSDSFNITVGCTTTPISIVVEDAPETPNYTVNLPETSTNGTTVQTVTGTYAAHTLTYSITSGDTYSMFTINPSTGVITLTDNTNLDYEIEDQFILNIKTLANDGKIANSTVTVNVTRLVEQPTHPNTTIQLTGDEEIGDLVYTIPQASYPHPPYHLSSLIYSVLTESDPGLFTSDLLDPTNMSITLAGTLPTGADSYTVTYRAQDNLDVSQYVDFTITIQYNPATLNLYLTEQASPYADANLQVKDNGTIIADLVNTGTGASPYTLKIGHTLFVDAYATLPSTGINPTLTLTIHKNAVIVFGPTTISTTSGGHITHSLTTEAGAIYAVTVSSHADPDVTYQNVRAHQLFTKNDCAGGQSGTTVDYVVEAGTYTSTVSQADADNQAAADITANGQNYANTNGECIVTSKIGTLLIDYYDDSNGDICFYCDTVGVAESGIPVTARANNSNTGVARYPNDGRDPATCYLLSSDRLLLSSSVKMRFGVNMAYFISQYPAIDHFTFVMKGRSNFSGVSTGIYALRNISEGYLAMVPATGEPSKYIPTVIGASPSGTLAYSTHTTSGGDGTTGTGIGNNILKLDYVVSTNTLTKTEY